MGLCHGLFNLSKLAAFLKPQVDAWTSKPHQTSAIVMALSRLKGELGEGEDAENYEVLISNLTVRSDLMTVSFANLKEVRKGVNALHNKLDPKNVFFTVSEGISEITLILEKEYAALIKEHIPAKAIYRHNRVAAIAVKIPERYLETPGFFYLLFQQLFLQNINLVEIASTSTELIFYLDQADVRLAFDTLYNRFAKM